MVLSQGVVGLIIFEPPWSDVSGAVFPVANNLSMDFPQFLAQEELFSLRIFRCFLTLSMSRFPHGGGWYHWTIVLFKAFKEILPSLNDFGWKNLSKLFFSCFLWISLQLGTSQRGVETLRTDMKCAIEGGGEELFASAGVPPCILNFANFFSQFCKEIRSMAGWLENRKSHNVFVMRLDWKWDPGWQTAFLRSIPLESLLSMDQRRRKEVNQMSFSNLQWKQLYNSQSQSITLTLANEMGEMMPFLSCGRTSITLALRTKPCWRERLTEG